MHPLAYFVTWRCYGTLLPGEPGSIVRRHNGFGDPTRPQSQLLADYARREMRDPPMLLGPKHRVTVAEAIAASAETQAWTLAAVNVRTNHVHVVIGASAEPGVVLRVLKANGHACVAHSGPSIGGAQSLCTQWKHASPAD